MQAQIRAVVRVAVEVLNPPRVESARPPNQAMYLVALGQQQLRQVRAVLAGNAGDERFFRHARHRSRGILISAWSFIE